MMKHKILKLISYLLIQLLFFSHIALASSRQVAFGKKSMLAPRIFIQNENLQVIKSMSEQKDMTSFLPEFKRKNTNDTFIVDIKQLLIPGVSVFDFGSTNEMKWAIALAKQYPGVNFTAIDTQFDIRTFMQKNVWWKLDPDLRRINYKSMSFFKLYPNELGQSDVITLNSPFCTKDFVDKVRSGHLMRAINRNLKPGGMAFVYTEWWESQENQESKDHDGRYEIDPEGARKAFIRAIEEEFGEGNWVEMNEPPKGYLEEQLISYELLQKFKEAKAKDKEALEYKVSFFQIRKPVEGEVVDVDAPDAPQRRLLVRVEPDRVPRDLDVRGRTPEVDRPPP